MDYKEKYEAALKRAQDFENGIVHFALKPGESIVHWIFPELCESEDEKIRKAIIKSIEEDSSVYEQEVSKEQMLAYLEKQKEQKPAEWSEEDEKIRRNLMSLLANMRGDRITEETYQKYYPWLKSIRPSKKINGMKNSSKIIDKEFESLWENDFGGKHFDVIGKTDLREIVEHFYELGCSQTKKEIGEYCYSQPDRLNVCGNPIKLGKRDFLASIMDFCENGDNYPVTEDEPSWKPSEEQMDRLFSIIVALRKAYCDDMADFLANLRADLKKLGVKEEPEYYQHFDPDC